MQGKETNNLRYMKISFLIYLVLFFISVQYNKTGWLLLTIWSMIMSVILLLKHKLPSKKGILLSLGLTAVYSLWLIVQFSIENLVEALFVFIASIACATVFEKYKTHGLKFVKDRHGKEIFKSVFLGLFIGLVLGIINLILGQRPMLDNIDITHIVNSILVSLKPAIGEEILYRAIFYAFCLHLLGGEIYNKSDNRFVYFMMVVPHVIPHTPHMLEAGLISWIISILTMSLLFGLPFALIQRKRDVLTAIIAHGFVDVIRFVLIGLPF